MMFLCSHCYAYPIHQPVWTNVEKKFLQKSGRQATYPNENAIVLETENPFELGKLAAMRFIEWVLQNPNGVIALSTSSTTEYFIRFLHYYKNNWHHHLVRDELREHGIYSDSFPDTSNLKFVQTDSIYPMESTHVKNPINYIQRNYCELLELKPENTLLMNITESGILAHKGVNVVFMNGKVNLARIKNKPSTQLDHWQQRAILEVDQFCAEYEQKIKEWGGIGLYLGSVGFDNNVAFNLSNSGFDTTTRIVKVKYMSAAHLAKDLGGIKFSAGKAAITLGLKTITFNKNATFLLIIAGEAKAETVRNALENNVTPEYPATWFQNFPNARFYITSGAAIALKDRQRENVIKHNTPVWSEKDKRTIIMEVALMQGKRILDLTATDFLAHNTGSLLINDIHHSLADNLATVHDYLVNNIENSLSKIKKNKHVFAHTAPHPDDVFLGYYPVITKLKDHSHSFLYITSGYNAVTDEYLLKIIRRASNWWIDKYQISIFNKPYSALLKKIKFHYYRNNVEKIENIITLYAVRNIKTVFDIQDSDELKRTLRWLKDDYFLHKRPGDIDIPQISMLKGMMRESEAESLWVTEGVPLKNFFHLRSKFYDNHNLLHSSYFSSDSNPVLALFNELNPDIITLADDPTGIRPSTNYKSMQVVATALAKYLAENTDKPVPKVWGYRNVWFNYSVTEANIMIPVPTKIMSTFNYAFHTNFVTQSTAAFPSPFYEGDFASLTIKTQIEQKQKLEILLGTQYFKEHPNPAIKESVGFVFLQEMDVQDFITRAAQIKASTKDIF